MRAWKTTLGLAFIAALAAVFAPRLLSSESEPFVYVTVAAPEVSPMQPAVHRATNSMIPEVESTHRRVMVPNSARPVTPPPITEPIPPPPHVWDDCPGCGMG